MDWDERFLRGDELHGYVPSPPLPQAIEGIAPGRALDLACGAGRHAIFLAERGWKVHAIRWVPARVTAVHARTVRASVLGFSLVLSSRDTRTRLTHREFVIATGHHSR